MRIDADPGVELIWNWIQPNGMLYDFGKQVTFAQGQLDTFDRLDIKGRAPATLPGWWIVEFFANSQKLFRIPFSIDGISVTATSIYYSTSTTKTTVETTRVFTSPPALDVTTFVNARTTASPSSFVISNSNIIVGIVVGLMVSIPISLYRLRRSRGGQSNGIPLR